ncbi:unnamed protein product [Didymodactylos carnosus]|uniref:Protein tyrosine phosphatase type IVA 3 n=1 Tax=Didymodactylos carnosus TaxID=1234261 RepID=A0A813NNA7_9BILA|nr:unnamed protein product [Didymodactylos carnosus]CAF1010611.1 unnamed protein product [Didymodactylos carnosus]CAF3516270.1 unnamed protein product [Didymodactylos carnosus]CAF3779455.1 unnamed protein product [Didymodactylos carnosus]
MPIQRFLNPAHTEIKYKQLRFLITDCPDDDLMTNYIDAYQKFGVTAVVRVCEQNYDKTPITNAGMKFYDLVFPDGTAPDTLVREKWVNIIKENIRENPNSCIAIHCVHGLGRSPVMVALALREAGMSKQDCIDLIKAKRRGSFNLRQLEFLQKYRPNHRLSVDKQTMCTLM